MSAGDRDAGGPATGGAGDAWRPPRAPHAAPRALIPLWVRVVGVALIAVAALPWLTGRRIDGVLAVASVVHGVIGAGLALSPRHVLRLAIGIYGFGLGVSAPLVLAMSRGGDLAYALVALAVQLILVIALAVVRFRLLRAEAAQRVAEAAAEPPPMGDGGH